MFPPLISVIIPTYNEIEKLNGEIKVESEIGVGSKFIITLPYEGGL